MNRLQMESEKRQVEYKDVCNKSSFLHSYDQLQSSNYLQKGQTGEPFNSLMCHTMGNNVPKSALSMFGIWVQTH